LNIYIICLVSTCFNSLKDKLRKMHNYVYVNVCACLYSLCEANTQVGRWGEREGGRGSKLHTGTVPLRA
jgi:hypothetical protein